jgi:hypothetical protein
VRYLSALLLQLSVALGIRLALQVSRLRRNEDEEERAVSEKSSARVAPTSKPGQTADRDTLPDQEFLRDQMEALLASPAVTQTRRALQDGQPRNETDLAELDTAALQPADLEPDTEPNPDAELIKDALRAAGKSA